MRVHSPLQIVNAVSTLLRNLKKDIRVGIIGGTGYTGAELLRLLAVHPNVRVEVITSRAEAGTRVSDIFPNLDGYQSLRFEEPLEESFKGCDVIFCATPNGVAMQHAQAVLESGAIFIDLAADFRLLDAGEWEQWYGQPHAKPELLDKAVYGLPEVFRTTIAQAKLVANPGCYPTASLLGLYPALAAGCINEATIVIDAKSGVTGAGRGANVATLFSEVSDSFKAYGASGHRHHPEISQIAGQISTQGQRPTITFIPHLVPMLRGIHATIYCDLTDPSMPIEDVHALYQTRYAEEAFVDVLPLSMHPETRSVKASNMCRIGVHKAVGSNKLVVLSVIDNLTKGAAGQAIQNMNLCLGLSETTGLLAPATLP